MNLRRRHKEREAGEAGRTTPDKTWSPLLELLDEELSALPERYRTPIVLCDLKGLPYRVAAARLGCPRGTLSGRLTRGRALLARRIARHGLPLPAWALAAALSRHAAAAVPPTLLVSALQFASPLNSVSPTVNTLAMMLLNRFRMVTGVFALIVMAVAVGWLFAARGAAQTGPSGEDGISRPAHGTLPSAPRQGDTQGQPREADFVLLAADREQKTLSLVVSGSVAPVLCLPMTDDLRILAGDKRVAVSGLRPGARVSLRMDPSNRSIQEIWIRGENNQSTVVRDAAELNRALREPAAEEVLRALPKGKSVVPYIHEASRDDMNITTELLVDRADPPRFFPLVGWARLHHREWKCTVHYTETVQSAYPFPFLSWRPHVEVVYIDRDFLVPTK
jgi:hypothetical protein